MIRNTARMLFRRAGVGVSMGLLLCIAPPSAAVEEAGRVAGLVRLEGEAPEPFVAERGGDVAVCGPAKHAAETLVVGEDGALANAFVWIADIEDAPPMPANPSGYVMDQVDCVFTPHALLVPRGQTVVFKNSDPVLHNVHLRHETENRHFNKVGRKGHELKFEARAPGVLHVVCNLHRWMDGVIVVAAHKFYAKTDADGQFVLEDVPPGDYAVRLYHESLGDFEYAVTVRASETTNLVASLPAPAEPPPPFGLEK